MILEAFACVVFSVTEITKTQHYSLEENTKEKFYQMDYTILQVKK